MTAPLAEVSVLSADTVDPIGTVAIPTRERVAAQFLLSMLLADWSFTGGRLPHYVVVEGSQLPLQRNLCVHLMRGPWLLFIDDDMVFQPDTIGRLISTYWRLKEEHEEPLIVGGLCVRRGVPHQPTLYVRKDEHSYQILEDWDSDIVEVDATGGAFVLIERAVFEAIMGGPMPSPEVRAELPPWQHFEWYGAMSEDLRFCQKARAAGARVFVDTRIVIDHMSSHPASIRDFWGHAASRSDELIEHVRAHNDLLGLPTLTREDARRRLDGVQGG